jgi:hypothetical protein
MTLEGKINKKPIQKLSYLLTVLIFFSFLSSGAMKNSVNSIRSGHMGGFPVLLPYLDDDGRSILFNDWTNVTNIATGQPIDFEEVRSSVLPGCDANN